MKRILITLALALAGCGVSPEELEGKTSEIKDGAIAGCETLDDAFIAASVDILAELTGTSVGVQAIRASRKALCDAAVDPEPAEGELSPPVPVAKPAEG